MTAGAIRPRNRSLPIWVSIPCYLTCRTIRRQEHCRPISFKLNSSAYSSTRTSADELEASATLSPLPELALEYTIRRAIGIARRDADPPSSAAPPTRSSAMASDRRLTSWLASLRPLRLRCKSLRSDHLWKSGRTASCPALSGPRCAEVLSASRFALRGQG